MTRRAPFIFILLVFLILSSSAGGATSMSRSPLTVPSAYLPLVVRSQAREWIGPDGGLISTIVIDPQNAANMYAGSWGGGVYVSSDGGVTWKKASQGLENLVIVSLAIDPAHPDTLYAGTYRGKVYKSSDSGTTWNLSSTGIQDQAIVYSIVIEPLNTQRVYAATRGLSNNNNQPWAGVVYRSDNGGTTWSPSLSNLGGSSYQDYVYALEINPNAPQIIFAATHEHGPVRSKNYGSTWQVLGNGITNTSTRAIVVDPRSAYMDTVYTGVWTRSGVFKSTNGGDSWVLKSDGLTGANIYGLVINPFAPRTVYAATYNMGVMKTTSGANTWFASGLSHVGIASLQVSPADGQAVFAGTAGDGLYVSHNGGTSWQHSQAHLSATSVTSLAVSPLDPASYFAGTDGNGIMYTQNSAQSWGAFNNGLLDRTIHSLIQHPVENTIFALTNSAGLYRCDLNNTSTCWQPGGLNAAISRAVESATNLAWWDEARQTFLDLYSGAPPAEQRQAAAPLLTMVFAPSDPNIAYIGTGGVGVYKSINGGVSWTASGWTSQNVWSIAVHPQNANTLYGATDQTGIVRASLNGGASWSELSLPGLSVYALAISPAQPNTPLAGTSNGVYRYASGVWTQIGLSGQTVMSLHVHPSRPELLVAGTTSGAWISTDSGSSWYPGPGELNGVKIFSTSFSPHDPGLVFYNTLSNGTLRAGIGY